jgi:hypothetical protein
MKRTFSRLHNGNLHSKLIANNDNITIDSGAVLTIDTSTVDINDLTCITFGTCRFENTSTTTPIIINIGSTGGNRRLRFESGGVLEGAGNLIQIGTGDGTANQVITLPTSDTGANMPNLGGLWSDQGDTLRDSSSIPRLHMQVSDASNPCTLEEVREIFTQDTVANTVTMVYPVPNGQPIYMSNIIIAQGATASGNCVFDLANSGTLNFQYVHISDSFDPNFTSASSTTLDHVAIADTVGDIALNNQINPPQVTSCVFVGPTSTPSMNLNASASTGTFKNVWLDSGLMNNTGFGGTNTSGGYFERCRNTCYRATVQQASNGRGGFYFTGPNHTMYDCVSATGSPAIYAAAGSGGITVDNLKVLHGCRTTHSVTTSIGLVRFQNTANNTVTRLHHQDPAVFGGWGFRGDAVDIDSGAVECTFDDVVIHAGAQDCNAVLNEAGVDCRYNNFTIYGQIRNRILDFNTSSKGAQISNFVMDEAQTQVTSTELGASAKIDQVSTGRNSSGISTTAIGTGVDCLSAVFYDFDDTDQTTGRWFTRMSPTVEETDYLTIVTQTGAIVFNNNNRLYMTAAGDQVELESRVHYNITGSTGGYGNSGSGIGNFTIEFALRRPGGAYTAYRSPSSTNFNTSLGELAADAQNRVQVKWRITRDVSNATDYIAHLFFNIDLSGDPYPFVLVAPPTLTIESNIDLTGAEIRIYDNEFGDNNLGTELVGTETHTGATYSTDQLGTNNNVWIQIIQSGYVEFGQAFTIGESDVTFTANLQLDNNA